VSAQTIQRLLDEAELRRTAEIYARGADDRSKDDWQQVLAVDCTIEGPGFATEGLEACCASINQLGVMFRATRHLVQGQTVTIEGDTASGETLCAAEHLLNDADTVLVWAIRYRDRWRRDEGVWRFVRRTLLVEWEETRPVTVRGYAA
jgi:hypothetical protein